MERLTTRHNGVAVIKDKHRHKEAMEKLARYEELEEANEQAKELVTVRISIYFEIKDAAIYGGIGSIGYLECAVSGNGKMLATNLQNYADGYKYDMASLLHVPEECIRIISEEEYKDNTEDEEQEVCNKSGGWIPVNERFPENDKYILLSFSNFDIPVVGRYKEDIDGGAFFVGDDPISCSEHLLFVNAWQPLPEPYKEG